ncbi:hypothetical protein B0H13DRAFT_2573610 [Mycena leptocephala]|nr:hypothetical protein B0H13DRAFT_2573610 [Mycena leptocephala]
MENDDHANDEFTSNSAGNHYEFSSSHNGGGIFSGSHHFTVAGGTFNNFTKNYSAATVRSDFRMIPLGDIDLQHELRLNKGSAVLDRRCERASVRRVYSARIEGRNAPTTVAMYQGPGAGERWQQDIANHMSVRRVTFKAFVAYLIFGAASSGGVHATFFHGDLIPYQHFLELHRHSPFLTVYIPAICFADFAGLREYFSSTFQTYLDDDDCTFWIRRSTGRLCADLIPSDLTLNHFWYYRRPTLDMWRQVISLNGPNMGAMVIDSLTLEEFHVMCAQDLARGRPKSFATPVAIHLGAVIVSSGSLDPDYLNEIVPSSNIRIDSHRWETILGWQTPGARREVTEDGWTRFDSGDVSDNMIQLRMDLCEEYSASWLSQANHIFTCLGITSNFSHYEVVLKAFFNIIISEASGNSPSGYLFVCPEKHLQIGPSSFRLPDCPSYWSLDPSGAERLSPEEAAELGFPSIELDTTIYPECWGTDVYAALRQFHRAKGFDPDSQDVARQLGYTLFQLPSAMDPLFAHVQVEDTDSDSQEDNEDTDADGENHVHESTTAGEVSGPPSLRDKMPVSRTFRFFMNIQRMLFLFLAVSWLYAQLW